MKKMTCRQMGGPCDAEITAASYEEIVAKGMEHVKAAHPEMVADIEAMTPEQMTDWDTKTKAAFETAPEVAM